MDITSSLFEMIYPALESIIITGLCWMAIGYVDAHVSLVNPAIMHNTLVVLWIILLLLRCVVPIIRQRNRRIMVTNQRVILRTATFRGTWESIPLDAVRDIARRRKGIFLAVAGHDRSIYLPKVPKAKKVVAVLEDVTDAYRATRITY
ncbi:MAG: hypothetical protein Q3976_07525 [Corynebacterium sp.]|nr:hypothetical protein [Corynebacterium sp.]